MEIISSADPSAEFFQYDFIAQYSAEDLSPVAVMGTNGSTVYVKLSRGNPDPEFPFDAIQNNL